MAAATDIPSPSWLDYGIFVLTLCLSAAVGLYYTIVGVKRKEKQSNAEYLLGNRQLPVWPTAISVLATSSISLIGVPAEVYTRGNALKLHPSKYPLVHMMKCNHSVHNMSRKAQLTHPPSYSICMNAANSVSV